MFLRRTGCTSLEREEHTKQALAIGALEFKTPRYLPSRRMRGLRAREKLL